MFELLTFTAATLAGAVLSVLAMVAAYGPAAAFDLWRRLATPSGPRPRPLPRPEPFDLYPQARHRNTNDEKTVRLPKLPTGAPHVA